VTDLEELRDRMQRFTTERDWERFHDPKSLVLALVGEVGELSELLQWLPADQVVDLANSEPLRSRLGEELADVLLYLLRLADVLNIHLGDAARQKMLRSEERFPADQVRSVAPLKFEPYT
jgi:NTP pyrophosphatase (non-canonical NTP hydrolase)